MNSLQQLSLGPPEIENVVIDPAGDLEITVIEYDRDVEGSDGPDGTLLVLRTATFQVQRAILMDHSDTWKVMLDEGGPWQEASGTVELKDDTIISMELWFRVLHGAVTDEMPSIPVAEVWHAIEASRKYFLRLALLKNWFAMWFGLLTKEERDGALQELLYPCMSLDNVRAFLYVTRKLTYDHVGHIIEKNPTHHRHLHLTHNVIQQLNAAKGSLRARIHRGIFDVIKDFLEATCSCKEKALFSYCIGLYRTEIWPLEDYGSQTAITAILTGLEDFQYTPPTDSCIKCMGDRGVKVSEVQTNVRKSFEGLCLDCMDLSNPNTGDSDGTYWTHHKYKLWEKKGNCRIAHGQPTWYFSYMGRKVLMDMHHEKAREHNERERRARIFIR